MSTPRSFTVFIPELDRASEATSRGIDLARGLYDRGATVRIVTLVGNDVADAHVKPGRAFEHGVEVLRCPSQLDHIPLSRMFSPLFRDAFSNEERYVRVALNHQQLVPSVYVWRSLVPMNQRDVLIGVDLYAPLTLGVLAEFGSRSVALALPTNRADEIEPWAMAALRGTPLALFDNEPHAESFRGGARFPQVSSARRSHEDSCVALWDRLFAGQSVVRAG